MDISFGFIIAFVLILFPGLVIRRLFYYGEFSKQFSGGISLIKLITISSIPGLINLVVIFFFYDNFISHIRIEEIVNTCKDLNNPEHHLNPNSSKTIKDTLNESVFPFFGFLYTSSLIIGLMSGRLIRITRIDTRFKLLRFKNYWFYVFSGELTRFKKLKHMKEVNKKHLFTVADILIDSDGYTNLYSGVVVDYELNENDSQVLNKVILQNAERFKTINNKRERVKIPGNLLVVDCSKMRNINLTYVFEQSTSFLGSKVPAFVTNAFGIISILLIPSCIFRTEFISWHWYTEFFTFTWYEKIFSYLLIIQVISILNPYTKNEKTNTYKYVGFPIFFFKVIAAILFYLLLYYL